MSTRRITDSDLFWWILSGSLGIGVVFLGRSLTRLNSTAVSLGLLLIPMGVLAAVGYLRPDRPWRWALAYFLASQLVVAPRILDEGGSVAFWIVSLLLVLPLNLAGVYLGYAISPRKRLLPASSPRSRPARMVSWAAISSLVIGGSVFVTGFFGPMILDPTAAQGPLMGFLMAPPAALAGLVLGAVGAGIGVLSDRQLGLLLAGAAMISVVSLMLLMAFAD